MNRNGSVSYHQGALDAGAESRASLAPQQNDLEPLLVIQDGPVVEFYQQPYEYQTSLNQYPADDNSSRQQQQHHQNRRRHMNNHLVQPQFISVVNISSSQQAQQPPTDQYNYFSSPYDQIQTQEYMIQQPQQQQQHQQSTQIPTSQFLQATQPYMQQHQHQQQQLQPQPFSQQQQEYLEQYNYLDSQTMTDSVNYEQQINDASLLQSTSDIIYGAQSQLEPNLEAQPNVNIYDNEAVDQSFYAQQPLSEVVQQQQQQQQQQHQHQQGQQLQRTLQQEYYIGIQPHQAYNTFKPSSTNTDSGQQNNNGSLFVSPFKKSQEWFDSICANLIEHMTKFGICVMDNFLGSANGNSILSEVHQLFNNCQSSKGELVSEELDDRTRANIRGDRVIWVEGFEMGCDQINSLIQILCQVVSNCSRLSSPYGDDKNEFKQRLINKRTKAMIACYPGKGSHYVKHIDNPNGDGRCITSIYYLNKDWNTEHDGGLLRMFPIGAYDEVANISPLFDRVLFFWSDRRNPHEVQPAQRIRLAITVWFIDSLETEQVTNEQQQQSSVFYASDGSQAQVGKTTTVSNAVVAVPPTTLKFNPSTSA